MAIVDRVFGLTIMGLIVVFSIIHLGVSVGIIVPFRKYGNVFRPQIGLSAFNLVICFFGLITGILGIIALALNSERFGRIVCMISGVLGIFALSSLISALVINDRSPNYVNSQFLSNLMAYSSDTGAQNRIDLLQNKYQCCGSDTWTDWKNANLNGTSTQTNVTTTTTATTASAGTTIATTPSAGTTIATTPSTGTTIATTASTGTPIATSNGSPGRRKRGIGNVWSDQDLPRYSRNKRQIVSSYGGILGLPISFVVVLPQSCCASNAILTGNDSNAYCISYYNGTVNSFRTNGCSRPIERVAGNQLTGFVVINSFMVVLAFVAIPVLLGKPSDLV